MRPRLLDLFCGAGGAAMGYHRAGFDVVGVDIRPQPNYPFEFHQHDVFDPDWDCWADLGFERWDAIHASPPCQAHTSMSRRWRKGNGTAADSHPDLIGATRDLLCETGLPWVIENVEGARPQMGGYLVRICGASVGIEQSRHRLFECRGWMPLVPQCRCRGAGFKNVLGEKPDGRWLRRDQNGERRNFVVSSIEEAQALMGINWMPEWRELCEAIPPAYTEFIGQQLLTQIRPLAASSSRFDPGQT